MNCPLCNTPCTMSKDQKNPFSEKIECPSCHTFYLEPGFRSQLSGIHELYGESVYQKAISVMKKMAEQQLVVFVTHYDAPLTQVDSAIYLECSDICDAIGLTLPDVNGGSYGD